MKFATGTAEEKRETATLGRREKKGVEKDHVRGTP